MSNKPPHHLFKVTVFLPVLLLCLLLLNISLGSIKIPLSEIFMALSGQQTSELIWNEIIWNFRVPKAITCVLAGSALSLGGLQMQTLFRNPLVGPDVLGLSAGASLAVSLLLLGSNYQNSSIVSGPWSVAATATLGCIGVFLIVSILAERLQDSASLLIVGLMIGAGTSSIVSVLQFISSAEELQTYVIWTFGNVGSMSWPEIYVLFVIFMLGSILAYSCSKPLNAWLLGENYAKSLGIQIKRSRFLIILSASLLTGAVTAFCGPIVFVGIAVPHLIKLLMNTYNHKVLIPTVMMGGAILLLLCDILAQLPGSTQVLPLNAITAIFGAPIVVWIVMRHRTIR